MSVRLLPSGESALLIECDGLDEVLALHDALAAAPPDGVLELVPAARTLLVAVDPDRVPLETAAAWVRRTAAGGPASPAEAADVPVQTPSSDAVSGAGEDDRAKVGAGRSGPSAPARSRTSSGAAAASGTFSSSSSRSPSSAPASLSASTVVVPVAYDGADFDAVAALLDMSPEALVARHTAATWRVAFIGFAPGFAYLVSDDWPFDAPRLDVPRTRVPAGAVGLAGGFSGVYPRESPGGWQIIGRTALPLWDLASDPPARLAPGTRVRFERAEA